MRAKPDGFELTFTQPVARGSAANVASYQLHAYTYIFQSTYGSPEVDRSEPTITSATVAADNKSVRLVIDGFVADRIYELTASGLKSASDLPLLHKEAYYTLNRIPR